MATRGSTLVPAVGRVAYSVAEAAVALGVNEKMMREMLDTRQLSHIRSGVIQTRILIPVSSIDEMLKGKR